MKVKYPIVFALILLNCIILPTQAQYNVVKMDALGLISNMTVARIGFERSLSHHVSLGLTFESGKYASSSTGSLTGPMFETYKVTGWGLMPEIRLYPFNTYKPAPVGFFIGSHFRYRNLKETNDKLQGKPKGNAYSFGINWGYKIRISQFIMDIALGYGAAGGGWPKDEGTYSFTNFEDKARIEFSLGFVFPNIPRKDKSGEFLYL